MADAQKFRVASDDLIMRVRQLLQWLWVRFLAITRCLWWAKRQLRNSNAVVVLNFHRVLDDTCYQQTNSLPGIALRRSTFAQLAEHVTRRYDVVDLRATDPNDPSSKLRVAFTFDDGWHDNYTTALPIARAYEIPFTVFLCPGLSGVGSPFWPERVVALLRAASVVGGMKEIEATIEELKRCSPKVRELRIAQLSAIRDVELKPEDRTLSWEEVAEMDQEDVNFGSHTQTHEILTRVPLDRAREEIRESKAAIERALGTPCELFAYPNGNWSPELNKILAEEGYKLAFTTARGAWIPSSDRLAIPRVNVYEDNLVGMRKTFSPMMFEYTIIWKAWRALKRDPDRNGAPRAR